MKPTYNAVLILEAIAKATIPDDVKLKAVNDLEKMYADKEYGRRCGLSSFPRMDHVCPNLSVHHAFYASDLGMDFWDKMDQIISQ